MKACKSKETQLWTLSSSSSHSAWPPPHAAGARWDPLSAYLRAHPQESNPMLSPLSRVSAVPSQELQSNILMVPLVFKFVFPICSNQHFRNTVAVQSQGTYLYDTSYFIFVIAKISCFQQFREIIDSSYSII